jgi:hypothetical protein
VNVIKEKTAAKEKSERKFFHDPVVFIEILVSAYRLFFSFFYYLI